MGDVVYSDRRGSVAESELIARLDRFATLATRLDSKSVAAFPLGSHACHVSHVDKLNESVSCSNNAAFDGCKSCFRWLSIAVEEGHLEPSQPCVGREVGWPQRMINENSLWTDFSCWFRNEGIAREELPDRWVLYELLDRIFIRHSERYEIPSLEHCRKALTTLRLEYERN